MIHILLTLFYCAAFWLIIGRLRWFRGTGIPVRAFQVTFVIKVLFGLLVWAIYTYHYTYRNTSDAFRYFDSAMVMLEAFRDDPRLYFRMLFGWELDAPELAPYFNRINGWSKAYNYGIVNDNPTVIRINAVVALFSGGHYHVHTAFMNFMALFGLNGIYRVFIDRFPGLKRVLFLAVFGIPSVLFWGSGVLKEAPLLGFLGLMTWGLFECAAQRFRAWSVLALVVGLTGMVFLKMYVLIALLPAIDVVLLAARKDGSVRLWLVAVIHLVSGWIALNARNFYPPGDLPYILRKKRMDFYNVAEMQEAGSVISIPEVHDGLSMLTQAPVAWYTAYLRPGITDLHSLFHLPFVLENALLAILVVWTLLRGGWTKPGATLRSFSISFVLVYGLLVGFTVPILGAIVRYQLPALPFLFAALLTGSLGEQIEQRLKGGSVRLLRV